MSVRIQFDLSDKEWERMSKYIPNLKSRHTFGHIALIEWFNRKQGRDKRIREENLINDAKRLQKLIDSRMVKI